MLMEAVEGTLTETLAETEKKILNYLSDIGFGRGSCPFWLGRKIKKDFTMNDVNWLKSILTQMKQKGLIQCTRNFKEVEPEELEHNIMVVLTEKGYDLGKEISSKNKKKKFYRIIAKSEK